MREIARGGAAGKPAHRPDPKPVPALRCEEGTPPIGWEFLGAVPTPFAWVMPCPCCVEAAVPLVPDGSPFGYRIAFEHGCGEGCPPALVAWWHAWRQGELPAVKLGEPTPRARAYARAAASAEVRSLAGPAALRDPRRAFHEAAFRVGRLLEPGGLPVDDVAEALLLAGEALGMDLAEAGTLARQALLAGMATPRELPR